MNWQAIDRARCALSVLLFFTIQTIHSAERLHTLTGTIRYQKAFHSRFLPTDRDLIVYLPPDYEIHKSRRYPVLYLHDGQNVFDAATSFIGKEWRADETAEDLIAAGKVEPLILVGISNAGMERLNEYTPTKDAKGRGGQADLYGKMLVEEVKPFIDRTYRTRCDARNTGLCGSSLGGLATMYFGLKYPKVFGKLAVISPSVWWDDKRIVSMARGMRGKPSQKIWLDIGTHEGGEKKDWDENLENARLLRDALIAKGFKPGKNLGYLEAEGAQHDETAWAARFPKLLQFLFPAHGRESRPF